MGRIAKNKMGTSGACLERDKKSVSHLPEGPGLYLIYDKSTRLLYVGSSMNIRVRAMQYIRGEVGYDRPLFSILHPINFTFYLLKSMPGSTKHELLSEELKHIEGLDTIYPNGLNSGLIIPAIDKEYCLRYKRQIHSYLRGTSHCHRLIIKMNRLAYRHEPNYVKS